MDSTISVGRESTFVRDIKSHIKDNQSNEIDFLILPLFHPRFRRDSTGVSDNRDTPSTRSDRELECKQWQSSVVGKISTWIDLDSSNQNYRSSSCKALTDELMWASHLCLQSVLLPTPRLHCPNYARSVSQLCSLNNYQQLWMRIPLFSGSTHFSQGNTESLLSDQHNGKDGWHLWDNFRHYCGHTHRLCVALELTHEITDGWNDDGQQLKRWAAEPVKAILINTNMFVTNKAGYPVLSKSLQQVLEFFFNFRCCRLVVTGRPHHSVTGSPNATSLSGSGGSRNEYLPYTQYLRHLKSRYCASYGESGEDDRATMAYRDTLQAPLQPLMDNLEAQTYETFERDPTKYERYERAIALALADLHSKTAEAGELECSLVVTVVGAGRGPLVAAALAAACLCGVVVRVYAVEKNRNAVITLRNRVRTELWSNVVVVDRDMRNWSPPELCDLMVSELLGSFGDNELSPECLDGAQKCLKADGVSIPADYTSFVAPMSSAKLWKCASEMMEGKGLDTPFVVKLHNFFQCADAQKLFRFDHPNRLRAELIDNSRFKTVSFVSPVSMTMHGLCGYFESTLYKDVMLSIEPATHTKGMFSWFPLFIPLSSPVQVSEGETISVSIWRCVDPHRVWYEWCVNSPVITPIQNSNGRSYHIGL